MTILVLGNITVDEAMRSANWPTPGHTIIVEAPSRDLGGKGANQALVMKRAGATTRLVAGIGRDDLAAWIVDTLAADGFRNEDLIRLPIPSDRSLIFVGPEGENAIASVIGCSDSITAAQARASLRGLKPGDLLVLQGNLTLETTRAACDEARRMGVRTVFNPSPMREGFASLLPLIDLLVVNESEAVQLGGLHEPADLARTLQRQGAAQVVLTLGGRGSVALGPHGFATVEAERVSVVDTTGAGDTYMGVLVAALFARGLAIEAAMRAASKAAAITVARHGTWSAFPSAAEIEAIFAAL